jgi:hypothetical protein
MAIALEMSYDKKALLHACINEIYLGQQGAPATQILIFRKIARRIEYRHGRLPAGAMLLSAINMAAKVDRQGAQRTRPGVKCRPGVRATD